MIATRFTWLFGLALLGGMWVSLNARGEASTPSTEEVLQELERSFADIKTVQTSFKQTKRMKLFEHPIELTGMILLQSPDHLLWRVDRPLKYAFLLLGNKAVEWDEETGKKKELPLSGNPVFEQILRQVRGWFSGRFSQLEEDYEIEVVGSEPLTLSFTPKDPNTIGKAVQDIRISVRDDRRYLETMILTEVNGDVTQTEFLTVTIDEPIPPEAWKVEPE